MKSRWIIVFCGVMGLLILGMPPGTLAGGQAPEGLIPARVWKKIDGLLLQCELCPRRCVIAPGQRGVCRARVNRDGSLYTLTYGYPIAMHLDPIEKKPFFHVSPGAQVFSLATAGCNMRCLFCQNWSISQADPAETRGQWLSPEAVVKEAADRHSEFIVFTYTEPTVFYEYMLDIAKIAHARGMKTAMHSCGYINPQPLKELLPYLDAVNIDLKGFRREFYQKMGLAELDPVLECLKTIKAAGVWLEITNLVIPGANDDPAEIREMCGWIKENLGADVPVHFTRFMPAFRLNSLPPTPVAKLEEAARLAKAAGLHFVYIGNVPGHPAESTYCPACGKRVVTRVGYNTTQISIRQGRCAFCNAPFAGRWGR